MPGERPRDQRKPHAYHHGNLRAALVEAGLGLVDRAGVDALTLRAVARVAAVSHSAPYHHFTDKAELLAAVAAAGFDRLVETIAAEQSHAAPEAVLDRLRGVGRGYVRFAVAKPNVFRLMFRPERTRPAEHPVLVEAEARAFGVLLSSIAECQERGLLPGDDPRLPALFAWSTVHGLATLVVDQVLAETPVRELPLEAIEQDIIEYIMQGLALPSS